MLVKSSLYEPVGTCLTTHTAPIETEDGLNLAVIISKIRSLFPSIQSELIKISPLSQNGRFWIAALQKPLVLIKVDPAEITLKDYDQEALEWILEYLNASENTRETLCNAASWDLGLRIARLAQKLLIPNLREKLEVRLLQCLPLPESFHESYKALPFIGKYLTEQTPHFKTEDEFRQGAAMASQIRNRDLLPSMTSGLINVSPLSKKISLWNAALQSPFFHTLMKRNPSVINLIDYDQEALKWILDYLESSDTKRETLCNDTSCDLGLPIALLAEEFLIKDLRNRWEVRLLQSVPLPESFFAQLEGLEFKAFALLHTFHFLIQLYAYRNEKVMWDEGIQEKVKAMLLQNLGKRAYIKLLKTDLPFLDDLPFEKGMFLDFFIDQEWKISEEDVDELEKIAQKTTCKYLKIDIIKAQLKFWGNECLRPSAKAIRVNGYNTDNYYPDAEQKPASLSKRAQEQKLFFDSPYPAQNLDLVVFLKNETEQTLALIKKYPEINFGLSLSKDISLKEKIDNVKLLAFDGEPPQEMDFTFLNSFPFCETLVVGANWLGLVLGQITLSFYTLWKNLTGTYKKVNINGWEFDWLKNPSTYRPEEITYKKIPSEEDQRIQGIFSNI